MIPAALIARKRDGEELTDEEIRRFVASYTRGDLPDYQMSAMAMAIYFQGMTLRETVALTRSLLESGMTLDWQNGSTTVDKHSTGGLGDKISLVLAPMLACCGVQVPMISGRGLGITGGTLDKMESIPGFRTDLSIQELQRVTEHVGCVITGASDELAPADRKLYALRDVTGTVPARPLIVASILSKKLAEGLQSLVLDVKVGSGAFMKTEEVARQLAKDLVDVGQQFGLQTTALLTDMDQPLGRAIGNAVEVQEAIDTLQGGGPADVLELAIRLGNELLNDVGIVQGQAEGHRLQLSKIRDGSAYAKFEEMVVAQGGRLDTLPLATSHDVLSPRSGYVHHIDAAKLGSAVIAMGGGRTRVGDTIDHGVGFECLVHVGSQVDSGQPLIKVFARDAWDSRDLAAAFTIQTEPVERRVLVIDRVKPC